MRSINSFCSMTITPSHIIEYLYCPRFTYFEYVLAIPQYEEKDYKVMRGRELHDEKLERNKGYLRKKIGVKEKYLDQYLTNDWLRGRVDEVLRLENGTLAPLDYKFAEYKDRTFETYQTQLYCYAWLIEDNFKESVKQGHLVYIRSRNKLITIPITEADKAQVRKVAGEVLRVIDKNYFPRATRYKRRCVTCTYAPICVK